MAPREAHRTGVLLQLAYDGAPYSGMAVQSNAPTVAETVHRAVRIMAPDASVLRVCSRTDSGVHARCQYAAFSTASRIGLRGWLLGLSGHLPPSIAVTQTARVSADFQPSKAAAYKIYRYLVLLGTVRDPFLADRAWRVVETLDPERMRHGARLLEGTHDFAAFRSSKDPRKDTVRTIRHVHVTPDPVHERVLQLEVCGTRFLHNMVRVIAGTLVDIGRGKREPAAISRALQSGNRLELGMTAPAHGLYLHHVELAVDIDDKWPDHSASQQQTPLRHT